MFGAVVSACSYRHVRQKQRQHHHRAEEAVSAIHRWRRQAHPRVLHWGWYTSVVWMVRPGDGPVDSLMLKRAAHSHTHAVAAAGLRRVRGVPCLWTVAHLVCGPWHTLSVERGTPRLWTGRQTTDSPGPGRAQPPLRRRRAHHRHRRYSLTRRMCVSGQHCVFCKHAYWGYVTQAIRINVSY